MTRTGVNYTGQTKEVIPLRKGLYLAMLNILALRMKIILTRQREQGVITGYLCRKNGIHGPCSTWVEDFLGNAK